MEALEKYYLVTVLAVLLMHITAACISSPVVEEKDSSASCSCTLSEDTSSRTATLPYLHKIQGMCHSESTGCNIPTFNFKQEIRQVVTSHEYAGRLLSIYKRDEKSIYSYFHPDPVGYYILTLEKIII